MKEVRAAIIGFGGIARAHNAGYARLKQEGAPVRLVAVCDVDPSKFESQLNINIDTGATGLEGVHTYTSVDDLIAHEEFELADICLPSFLHKEYAIKLMKAGKNVLSEKPMALSSAECDEMIAAYKETGKRFMIGQCLRFNSSYLFLKDCVESGIYGKPLHAFMERLSAQPRWGFEHWFEDTERCGGCILDMHIHDVDMARYLFGEPKAVSCIAMDADVKWAVENTRLYYDDIMVVINGSWDESKSSSFKSPYRVRFEKASVIYSDGKVTVYPDEGSPFEPELPQTSHMAEEIRFISELILDSEKVNLKNPPESARESVRIIEKLRESAALNGEIIKL